MGVKSKYYQLSETEFIDYLNSMKQSPSTQFFLTNTSRPYFYCQTREANECIVKLNRKMLEFDAIINSFSEFGRLQIIQSFFIEEIESTNRIEGIYSTRRDIFSVMKHVRCTADKKLISIANSYEMLLTSKASTIDTLSDIRIIYDNLTKGTLSKDDYPDGEYFRKGPVYITDGTKMVHSGIREESVINQSMEEFLETYNSSDDIFTRMIIAHFLIETIHPFYDGNGRLGRFLFSKGLYDSTHSPIAFLIAKAFSEEKNKYYSALSRARDEKEFGCLNEFLEDIASILLEHIERSVDALNRKAEQISNIPMPQDMTKSEQEIYRLISEATILSDYGVSSTEIQQVTAYSKRTIVNALNRFKENNLLEASKFGYYTYYRIRN